MKSEDRNSAKELYKDLRRRSWTQLWDEEVPRFDAAPAERRAAIIRAVGVVFAESGAAEEKENVREWLHARLRDPEEKIRRYAIAAIPKIGGGADEEQKLLSALRSASGDSEKKILARSLGKIGGTATLEHGIDAKIEQKVKAGLARQQSPSAVRTEAVLAEFAQLRIHLRGRNGLEKFVGEEVQQSKIGREKFRVADVLPGCVVIVPIAPFSIADIYSMRCFGTVGFILGSDKTGFAEGLASVITSELSRRLFRTFTEGTIRYRINYVAKGHQRAAVNQLASRVYAQCPEILNDARSVTWTSDIYSDSRGQTVELRPNMTPDPRFAYRRQDVPAASHPQLAACLARLAGDYLNNIIWDPFCGSGSELIESALLGGVRGVYGTDTSSVAIKIAEANYAASGAAPVPAKFICGDFRTASLGGAEPTLIITNPPMGMRVQVASLKQLIADLFRTAARVLKPGGRLVLVNPLSRQPETPLLKLQFQQTVDMGGFNCRLEKYLKA
ncbi:MAG TPA: methyltransferase [Verrucomicrobiae bacterium]|jgi:predicted RNA methylase